MKVNRTISLALAISLVTASVAFAQGDGNRDGYRDGNRYGSQQAQREYPRGDNGLHRGWDRSGRGAGPDQRWHRGDRLPMEYRHRNYVVDDWRGHRLSAPPRGYYWVQTGGDYVLVAIATGVIAQLVLGAR